MAYIHCSQDMQDYLKDIDTIVFDIDGVLIDTGSSFISTIVTTTQYYIKNILELPLDLDRLSVDDALMFKEHSGFNNDWDLTAAMVSFVLYSFKKGVDITELGSFLEKVDEYGGGLPGIEKFISGVTDKSTQDWIEKKVDYERIKKIFQEFYAGNSYCESLYGFSPGFFDGPGSVETEIVLLDPELIRKWQGKIGILTGRMRNETELALKMLEMEHIDPVLVEYTDYLLPNKPHPAKMVQILNNAGSRNALFVGDSIDDFLTSYNYINLNEERNLRFGLVAAENKSFPESAGAFRADSVNSLIGYVLKQNNG